MLKLILASLVAFAVFGGMAIPRASTAEAVGDVPALACIQIQKAGVLSGGQPAIGEVFQLLECAPL